MYVKLIQAQHSTIANQMLDEYSDWLIHYTNDIANNSIVVHNTINIATTQSIPLVMGISMGGEFVCFKEEVEAYIDDNDDFWITKETWDNSFLFVEY